MTAPAIFDYSGQQVRTVLIDGEPWFVAADVARILGYASAKDMTRSLDDDEKGGHRTPTLGGEQFMAVISEAGLYRAIVQRQTGRIDDDDLVRTVKDFQRWITHDVLPAIRRTGSYGQPRELSRLELIDLARDAEVGRLAAEAKVAELEPAADAWIALADASGDYSLREAAEILCRDERIHTGQNLLLKYLREIGWVDRKGTPYQSQINCGRLAVRTRTYDDPYTGEPHITTQIRVTAKGVDALHKLMTAPAGLRALPGGAA